MTLLFLGTVQNNFIWSLSSICKNLGHHLDRFRDLQMLVYLQAKNRNYRGGNGMAEKAECYISLHGFLVHSFFQGIVSQQRSGRTRLSVTFMKFSFI